ncbi:MAG: CBS domain-containing protein [Acidobacteria bacterium]|nr:CBS domain-containing protein [Acidobacteriota bacterium]
MKVGDIMIPIHEVPSVPVEATLTDVARLLREARCREPDRYPCRAVLVVDSNGRIVGKIGHLSFLRAVSQATPSASGRAVASQAPATHSSFLEQTLAECCECAGRVEARSAMVPDTICIEDTDSIPAAIEVMVHHGTLSVFVRRGGTLVGLLRLADVFEAIAQRLGQEVTAPSA